MNQIFTTQRRPSIRHRQRDLNGFDDDNDSESHEINPELLSKGAERYLFKEIIHSFCQNATKFYYFLLIDVKPDLRKRRTARGFYLPVRTDGMCAPCHAI